MNNKIKTVGVFNLFPHYRMAVYKKLWQDSELEFTLCAGTNTAIPSLKIHTTKSLPEATADGRFIALKNHWFGENFLWQSKVAWPGFYRNCQVAIHTGSAYQISTWAALLWARLLGKRTLLWTHGLSRHERGLRGLLRRSFYQLANGLLLYGHRARCLLIESGFDPESLYVVYNSLDYEDQKKHRDSVSTEATQKIKDRYFERPDLPILIYIGRLTAEKQPLLMLDLAERMKNNARPVNILIIGDGPELESLRQGINRRGLHALIHLHGACHDEAELAELMTAADIALMPGYVGLSAMHYLAYGLPVLTSDDLENQKPEVEAIVDGLSGGFYTHGSIDSLAQKVKEWLDKVGPKTRAHCISQIEQYYNPEVQRQIIAYACKGLPASGQPHFDNPGFFNR